MIGSKTKRKRENDHKSSLAVVIMSYFFVWVNASPAIAESQMQIVSQWSFTGTHTVPVDGPDESTVSGSLYQFPTFNRSLGELNTQSIVLNGDWSVSLTTSEPVYIPVLSGLMNMTFPGSTMGVETAGTGVVAGNRSNTDNGTYTSPRRFGEFTEAAGVYRYRPTATLNSAVSENREGTPVIPTVVGTASGTVEAVYFYNPIDLNLPPIRPIIIRDTSGHDVRNGFLQTVAAPLDDDSTPIGAVEEVEGDVFITRAGGTREPVSLGAPIYEGDIITSGENGTANILFVDETSMPIAENANISVDGFEFDAGDDSGVTNLSVFRGVFVYVSGLIGREDPNDVQIETPFGSLGFRGDAGAIIRDGLLNNPQPELGTVGIWTETTSPVGFSTFVDLTDKPLNLTFSIAFLNEVGDFSLELGDIELLTLSSSSEQVGLPERYEITLDIGSGAHLLSFNLDGPASNSMIVWDIEIDGEPLSDFSAIGRQGAGPVDSVYIATEEQLAALQRKLKEPSLLLRDNRWEQIALPAVVGGRTPQDLFGDDLPLDEYTREWIIYSYEPASNSYAEASLAEPLSRGKAYWIIQATGDDVTIDFEIGDNFVALETQADCPNIVGCYAVPLQHSEDGRDVTWNMIGYPFIDGLPVENTRIAFVDDATGEQTSVPLNNAESSGLIHNEIYVYNSLKGQYDVYADATHMNIWDAGWIALLPASRGQQSLSWLIPGTTSSN